MSCGAGEEQTYLSLSTGLCRQCGRRVEARYVALGRELHLEKHCPEHGISRALVAEDLSWYLDAMQGATMSTPPERFLERTHSCPQSCGPCELHAQRCNLPVFSITNACDLRCPICFTFNRADRVYNMSVEEFGRQIDFVVEATGGVDLVNLTGGEPTLHPQLLELLEKARRPEIGRVTLNSNGLTLADDAALARRLAELGVYVVLSCDTFDAARSKRIHGKDIVEKKRRALEQLERHGVQTTLLMVLVGGVNEDELGAMLELLREKDFVRSLTIQTMTYTGQGGGLFEPRQHLPVDRVERLIEEAMGGQIKRADFAPLPSAHPLCYGVSYLLFDRERRPHPFSRLLARDDLMRMFSEGYLVRPSAELEAKLKEAIERIWSEGGAPELLGAMKDLLKATYPSGRSLSPHERQRAAESMVKTIYVHAHMDEDTWEVGRAMRCPDQVPVDAERLIGACNYNLFYRQHDERFWVKP